MRAQLSPGSSDDKHPARNCSACASENHIMPKLLFYLLLFWSQNPRKLIFGSSTKRAQLEQSTQTHSLLKSPPRPYPCCPPLQGTARLHQWNTVSHRAVEGWAEEGTAGRRDSGTEGHADMLTEKVVLVTSPLLCAMPPLRLPGMPLPWCFFWLPTIVSMEWLRTRMALCGRGDRGQQVSTTQRGAVPRTPPQLQVFPRHMGEQPAYASPRASTPQQQHDW